MSPNSTRCSRGSAAGEEFQIAFLQTLALAVRLRAWFASRLEIRQEMLVLFSGAKSGKESRTYALCRENVEGCHHGL